MSRAFFLLALAHSAAAAAVSIAGLRQPTSLALDAATGAVFISEQAGLIKKSCLNCTSAVTVKDLTAQVYSFGCACALHPRALLFRAPAPRASHPSPPPLLPPLEQGTA
jgi:hypothetical protein